MLFVYVICVCLFLCRCATGLFNCVTVSSLLISLDWWVWIVFADSLSLAILLLFSQSNSTVSCVRLVLIFLLCVFTFLCVVVFSFFVCPHCLFYCFSCLFVSIFISVVLFFLFSSFFLFVVVWLFVSVLSDCFMQISVLFVSCWLCDRVTCCILFVFHCWCPFSRCCFVSLSFVFLVCSFVLFVFICYRLVHPLVIIFNLFVYLNLFVLLLPPHPPSRLLFLYSFCLFIIVCFSVISASSTLLFVLFLCLSFCCSFLVCMYFTLFSVRCTFVSRLMCVSVAVPILCLCTPSCLFAP